MESVSDLVLKNLHHPHAVLILDTSISVWDLAANCCGNNHLQVLVRPTSIPGTQYLSFLGLLPFSAI